MVTRTTKALATLGLLASVASCELGSTAIPRSDPVLVVHSILNPSDSRQFVLVEESLTGAQTVVDSGPYNPNNPIATGNGVPVGNAVVRLTGPNGFSATATEVRTSASNATGVYIIDVASNFTAATPSFLRTGERYFLTVQARGMTVTGSTLIPTATPLVLPPLPLTVGFNRDHDSVKFAAHPVANARAYWIRAEAAVAPFSIFSFDQAAILTGDTRNLFTEELVRLFFPGFLQTVTLAATDSNVYDYYRSGNDPFSGAGLINHLDGGLGVFGSIVVLEKRTLDVTQGATGDPIEALYTLRSGGTSESPRSMQLYLESKGPSAESDDRITGKYVKAPAGVDIRGAVFGFRTGASVELQILASQSTAAVSSIFRAAIRGDSLRGTFSSGASALYVKAGR